MNRLDVENFAQQLQAWQQRVAHLQQQVGELPLEERQWEGIGTIFEEFSIAWEELQVAHEQLWQQNEDLLAAHEALEAERQRYRELFEFAPDAYLVTDMDGMIQEANSAAATLLNRPQTFLVGTHLTKYIVVEERQVFRTQLNRLRQVDEVQEWEVSLRSPDTMSITVAVKVAVLRNPEGHPVNLRWIVRDITQRKRTELELQQANERLQLAATALDGTLYDWDKENNTIVRTHGLVETLGYCPEQVDLTPQWWQERIHPDDKQRVLQDLPNDPTCHSTFSTEYRIRAQDGSYLDLWDRGLRIRNATGQTVRVVGCTMNITRRKQAEEQVQRTAAEISQIFNLLPCFVWKFCPGTFQFIYASEVMTELSGISREAFLENPQIWDERVDLGHESQEALRVAWEAITKGEPYQVTYRFHTLHQGTRWFEITARPNYEEGVLYYYGSTTDITARKQAEEALHKSTGVLHTVVTNAPIVLYALDSEGRFTLSEGKALEAVGLQSGEVVGQSVFELYRHQTHILENLRHVLAGNEGIWIAEVSGVLYDNRAMPLRDETGQVIGLIGVATNVTERLQAEESLKRLNEELENRVTERTAELEKLNELILGEISERIVVEAALQQREQQFRALVEHAPDIIERFDRQRRHLYVNPAIEQLTGKPATEFIGKTNRELGLSQDNATLWEQALSSVFETGREEQIEFSVDTPKGLKYYQTRLVPELDGNDNPVSVLGISRDITDHKLALEALRESEERFRQLAENIDEVFWMRDTDHPDILFVSPAYEEIWGLTRESLYEDHTSWLKIVHPDDRDRVCTAVQEEVQGEYDQEYRIVRSDGSMRWIRDRSFPIRDAQGRVYRLAGITQDITARKQMELAASKALERERELSRVKSGFIAMTSHEFRNPLTTIRSSTELLERYHNKLSQEKQRTHLHRIQNSVDRMLQLLNDILLLSKAEANKLEFNPEPLDLVQLCRNLVDELQLTAKRQQAIVFTHKGDCTQTVQNSQEQGSRELNSSLPLLDEKLLRHILINLLSNASKYSPEGSTVRFDLTCHDAKAIFQIQDQGIGIPLEDQSRLFESFQRASNVGTIQGTGLGLAIVKQCVDLHRGEISLISDVGKGTTFTVVLPWAIQLNP